MTSATPTGANRYPHSSLLVAPSDFYQLPTTLQVRALNSPRPRRHTAAIRTGVNHGAALVQGRRRNWSRRVAVLLPALGFSSRASHFQRPAFRCSRDVHSSRLRRRRQQHAAENHSQRYSVGDTQHLLVGDCDFGRHQRVGKYNHRPQARLRLSGGGFTSSAATLANGAATIAIPANKLSVGTDTLTAAYSGDTAYNAASGTTSVTVKAPGTTTGAYTVTVTGTGSDAAHTTATTTFNLTVN